MRGVGIRFKQGLGKAFRLKFLFYFLGCHSSHPASVFPQLPMLMHRKGKARFRPASCRCHQHPIVVGIRISNRKPTCHYCQKPEGEKWRHEGARHPFYPLLSTQREGHMGINICSADNTDLLGILIKRRRLLNTLLLRAHLREPMLLFILNSDELSQFRSHTSAAPWSAGGWRLRRMEKINMKCQERGQVELVFPAGRSLGPPPRQPNKGRCAPKKVATLDESGK